VKITTNVIGNYSPQLVNNAAKFSKQNEVLGKSETKPAVKANRENLTTDEKKYFMGLYPENKSEINDYHFYKKSGEMSGVKIGSLFDKRG
jgi:hypothetical protein